jgi:hypothetical protein
MRPADVPAPRHHGHPSAGSPAAASTLSTKRMISILILAPETVRTLAHRAR